MGLFNLFKKSKPSMSKGLKKDINTNSGMWALWDYETYKDIDSYEAWEPLFCEDEDIEKQITKNAFVPVYTYEDGCRTFVMKIDEELSEKEEEHVSEKSEEYLFYSNGKAVLSGIDAISTSVTNDEAMIIDLPEGFYSVSVYLLDWEKEDFVVVLKSNADENGEYRKKVDTFSEED